MLSSGEQSTRVEPYRKPHGSSVQQMHRHLSVKVVCMADAWENEGQEGEGGGSRLSPSSLGGLKSAVASRLPTYEEAGGA